MPCFDGKRLYTLGVEHQAGHGLGSSLSDYLAMGGYAAYVWSAFGIAVALLVGLFVQSRHAARRREAELAQLRLAGQARSAARAAEADAARGAKSSRRLRDRGRRLSFE